MVEVGMVWYQDPAPLVYFGPDWDNCMYKSKQQQANPPNPSSLVHVLHFYPTQNCAALMHSSTAYAPWNQR
jgi:hypothetical protein